MLEYSDVVLERLVIPGDPSIDEVYVWIYDLFASMFIAGFLCDPRFYDPGHRFPVEVTTDLKTAIEIANALQNAGTKFKFCWRTFKSHKALHDV